MSAILLKNKGTLKDYIQENSAISAAQEKAIANFSVLGSLVFALIILSQIF